MQGMNQTTRDAFNATYRGLLDLLNERKKAGVKYDFAAELRAYEDQYQLDKTAFFHVRNSCPLCTSYVQR